MYAYIDDAVNHLNLHFIHDHFIKNVLQICTFIFKKDHFETVKYNWLSYSIIDKYVEKGPLFAQNVGQLNENCFMMLFYLSE